MLEWELVSIEISFAASLSVLKCMWNLISLSSLEKSGFNQVYEMKLGAFTNGEMHFNENLLQTFGRVSWTNFTSIKPSLTLFGSRRFHQRGAENRMVNYNHRRLGKDLLFARVWFNEILLREFDYFLGVLYAIRNKEHRLWKSYLCVVLLKTRRRVM